jgi:hypothetical protein
MSKKLNLSDKEIHEIRKKHETERNNHEFFSKKVFEPKKKLDEQAVGSVASSGVSKSKGVEESDGIISFSAESPQTEIAAKIALHNATVEGYKLPAKPRKVESTDKGYKVTYYFNKL